MLSNNGLCPCAEASYKTQNRNSETKRNETKQNEMKLNSKKPGDHPQPHLSMLVMVDNCMVAVKGSYKH